jgi:hypothetical protein
MRGPSTSRLSYDILRFPLRSHVLCAQADVVKRNTMLTDRDLQDDCFFFITAFGGTEILFVPFNERRVGDWCEMGSRGAFGLGVGGGGR